LEAGEVGAAFVRIDVVDEREGVLVVALVVLNRAFDFDTFAPGFEGDRLGMQRLAVSQQIFHELGETSLVKEGLFFQLSLALVLQGDRERLVEERQLAQPSSKSAVVE